MQSTFCSGATEFLSQVGQLLVTNEARYSLINSIAKRLEGEPHFYGKEDPWFCIVSDEKGVCAAGIRTPPFRVLLAHFSGDAELAASLLVDAVAGRSSEVPGATGDLGITDSFAQKWCLRNGVRVDGKQAQRIYRLDAVNVITPAPGNLRRASMEERDMLARWQTSATEDIYGALSSKVPVMDITPAIGRKDVYLWEDRIPVSMAARTRPTENGITVGLVYTPSEFRRRGYATSCVAALCSELLRSGYKFCTLYTDLANPASNSIYRRIGFVEVTDSVEYSFAK